MIRCNDAVELIARGRLGLRAKGQSEQGREDFHEGIILLTKLFDEAYNENDLFSMLLCESTFLTKDLEGARPSEKAAIANYENALADNAFDCLDMIKSPEKYKESAVLFSCKPYFRYKGMPKGGFIVALLAEPARIQNSMSAVGMDPNEQTLRELRVKTCKRAVEIYSSMQIQILGNTEI
jgi:hypothetical protein